MKILILASLQDFLSQPWPWYVGGPLIAFVMFLLLILGKDFGISANFRIMCAAEGADRYNDFFKFDWKAHGWNLMVAVGAMVGGYLSMQYLSGGQPIAHVSEATVSSLEELGMVFQNDKVPLVPEFYNWSTITSGPGLYIMLMGGFLIGFGARYAGGCTSGHAISGLSALQLPSLVAVIGFFLGGLTMTYLIFPLIF